MHPLLPAPGSSLGQYELVRPIGSGGMGVVFEARHRSLGRRVAIKVLHRGFSSGSAGASSEKRFRREGRAAAQVRHPHVVDVFDFGVEQGVSYLVMELIQGETLADHIRRRGALPLAEVVELMLPIVSAVAALHAANIHHRDLKPANILLARGGSGICPKVADFGVSRVSDGSTGATGSGVVLGTYPYMAPEQVRADRDAGEQIDQYALGVTLYESATGARPFAGKGPFELMSAILHGTVIPPSARNRGLPRAFDDIVLRAISRDPRDRYACVDELGEALLPFAEPAVRARWQAEFQAPGSQGVQRRPSAPSRLWVLAVAGCAVAVATAAWAVGPDRDLRPRGARSSAQPSVTPPVTAAPASAQLVVDVPASAVVPSAQVPSSHAAANLIAAPVASPNVPTAAPVDRTLPPKRSGLRPSNPRPRTASSRAAETPDNGAPILDPE